MKLRICFASPAALHETKSLLLFLLESVLLGSYHVLIPAALPTAQIVEIENSRSGVCCNCDLPGLIRVAAADRPSGRWRAGGGDPLGF